VVQGERSSRTLQVYPVLTPSSHRPSTQPHRQNDHLTSVGLTLPTVQPFLPPSLTDPLSGLMALENSALKPE